MSVVTFGEIMLRLSPPGYRRFLQAGAFEASYGGAEANVAVALAQYGLKSRFLTKLPGHEIGQACLNYLRSFGVDTGHIARGGERMGLYFVETGASQRSAKVIYDRAGSACTTIEPGEVDFGALFEGAAWFHWSGITPALGEGPRRVLKAACQAARKAGATVSCDLNYRSKLWTEQEAQQVMIPLMEEVDVLMAGRGDAFAMLGLEDPYAGGWADKVEVGVYEETARALGDRFGFKAVAITLRQSRSASRHAYSALLLDEQECAQPKRSRCYDLELVDRVGGGDAFSAGLIYGLLTKDDTREALEFGVAASCLKQTIPGDANLASVEEIEKLARSPHATRVER